MSAELHKLKLFPGDWEMNVAAGTRLQDALIECGVEFPCGGRGRCKGCRAKLRNGSLAVSDEEKSAFSDQELLEGWRLSCRHSATADLDLELAQWDIPFLASFSPFKFTPVTGCGIAIDLGVTTVAGQLLDLQTGSVLAVSAASNAQAEHGEDIMSRVQYAVENGPGELQGIARKQLGEMARQLLSMASRRQPRSAAATPLQLRNVFIVGNTAMHHLFCGCDVKSLAAHPFTPAKPERFRFAPADLGWDLPPDTTVEFLPCLGGLAGSDLLAGIIAVGMPENRELTALIDLGGHGGIVAGNSDRMICASMAAAGRAFEAVRISTGMRPVRGAIADVRDEGGKVICRVIGGGAPKGLCGRGLADAVATGLKLRWIRSDGQIAGKPAMPLAGAVSLLPEDIHELQMGKAAVAAGLAALMRRLGAPLEALQQVYLAGAFGNYISRASAQRIGMLRMPLNRVAAAGDTALLGAKRALFEPAERWESVARRVEYAALSADSFFVERYAQEMRFPS